MIPFMNNHYREGLKRPKRTAYYLSFEYKKEEPMEKDEFYLCCLLSCTIIEGISVKGIKRGIAQGLGKENYVRKDCRKIL